MRRLDQITARIIPINSLAHAHARRPRRCWATDQTTIVVMKIEQNTSVKAIKVSATGNPDQFAWLPRVLVDISKRDFGPFLLVTLTHQLASQKSLRVALLDWDRYSDSERADLKDAVEVARRTRSRLSGFEDVLPFPGRNAFA